MPQPRSGERRPPRKITAVRVLTALGVGALLYFARVAFVPLALAALFALVLSGPVELLRCVGVPRGVSVSCPSMALRTSPRSPEVSWL
jgi:predicted PurR-regulated permease PerM